MGISSHYQLLLLPFENKLKFASVSVRRLSGETHEMSIYIVDVIICLEHIMKDNITNKIKDN